MIWKLGFKGFHDPWTLLRVRASKIFQQSRTKWLRGGDANYGYFHSNIKMRRWRNSILAIKVGNRVKCVPEVRAEIVSYIREHFSESVLDRHTLDGVLLLSIFDVEASDLIVPFGDDEIRKVVIESDGTKSLGPDGFNFAFYKIFWELLKGEVGIMFQQFFHSTTLPQCFSRTSLLLFLRSRRPPVLEIFSPSPSLGPSISRWPRFWRIG